MGPLAHGGWGPWAHGAMWAMGQCGPRSIYCWLLDPLLAYCRWVALALLLWTRCKPAAMVNSEVSALHAEASADPESVAHILAHWAHRPMGPMGPGENRGPGPWAMGPSPMGLWPIGPILTKRAPGDPLRSGTELYRGLYLLLPGKGPGPLKSCARDLVLGKPEALGSGRPPANVISKSPAHY